MIELLVFELFFDNSDIDDDELAALGVLPTVSTRDFDRSLFCFCKNFGSFEPCGVDGGEVGD